MHNSSETLIDAYQEARALQICHCTSFEQCKDKIADRLRSIDENSIEFYAEVFKVLGNQTRLKILSFLVQQQKSSICEIASVFDIEWYINISHKTDEADRAD